MKSPMIYLYPLLKEDFLAFDHPQCKYCGNFVNPDYLGRLLAVLRVPGLKSHLESHERMQ